MNGRGEEVGGPAGGAENRANINRGQKQRPCARGFLSPTLLLLQGVVPRRDRELRGGGGVVVVVNGGGAALPSPATPSLFFPPSRAALRATIAPLHPSRTCVGVSPCSASHPCLSRRRSPGAGGVCAKIKTPAGRPALCPTAPAAKNVSPP